MGKKRPHRNIIGKRKKLENVWASKTSLTDTAMKSPKKVDTIPIRMMAGTTRYQAIPDKSARNAAIITGTKALTTPKSIAPEVLASMRSSREIGLRLSLAPRTVDKYRQRVMRKLGLESIATLTKYAIRAGLTSPEP